MSDFVEHNNRTKANTFGEFITGNALRHLVADKVHEYAGINVSVFDGAAGSGQLEQFINIRCLYAVDVQKEACEALIKNIPTAHIQNISFFLCHKIDAYDCAVMNPPFSIKLKDLSIDEIKAIQADFPWKKSGVVDDIFILKSLGFVKRYGFYIAFPGLAYRTAEQKMRELIGCQLAELMMVEKAFEDTQISVLFLIIDKQKTSRLVKTSIYNCEKKQIRAEGSFELNDDFAWETPRDEIKKEPIDIVQVNLELDQLLLAKIKTHLATQLLIINNFDPSMCFLKLIEGIREICRIYEDKYLKRFGLEAAE